MNAMATLGCLADYYRKCIKNKITVAPAILTLIKSETLYVHTGVSAEQWSGSGGDDLDWLEVPREAGKQWPKKGRVFLN